MITGPEDGAAAGHGRLRASHADREHVIDTLKTAFADGRLDKDDLDDRPPASRGQLPPRPGQPGQIAESERHRGTGQKPSSPHPTRTEQTRAGLPGRKSRQHRPNHNGQDVLVSRGARLVPDAAWTATASL